MSLEAVVSEICKHSSYLVTSHVGPEGDAVGSAMALALGLRSIGKKADVILRDPVPLQLSFLPQKDLVSQRESITEAVDTMVVVDCGDLNRTGYFSGERPSVGTMINIDHHVTNHGFGNINWIESDASATGEMVFDLLKAMNISMTPEIATALYTAIMSETGSYHYSNTTSKVFRMAADLLEHGADAVEIARHLYESQSAGKLRLMGEVFSGLSLDSGGKIAWAVVTLPMMERTGTLPEDTESFVNYHRYIDGVEVAILFRQVSPQSYKVSFRSGGDLDVSRIAGRFGGGGHMYASGCLMDGELVAIQKQVLSIVEEEIRLTKSPI